MVRGASAMGGPASLPVNDGMQGRFSAGGMSSSHATPNGHNDLAEVRLECVHSEGVVLQSVPLEKRTIVFTIDPECERFCAHVGRCHQPEFFEAMVPKKERFLCISRTHLELTWEPPASIPFLRKLSANHLFLDDRSVSTSESAPLPDGTRLDFSGASENDAHFLVLRVTLRRRNVAAVEGHYPALTAYNERQNLSTQVSRTTSSRSSDITAVLECIHATGADIGALAPEERVIILPLGETLEVGRQHQLGLFEHLLSAEPRWLGFISRAHVRVQLSRVLSGGVNSGSQHTLRIENLSLNPVSVGGRTLAKGAFESIGEGGTLAFLATSEKGEMVFLEFQLRRARQQPKQLM